MNNYENEILGYDCDNNEITEFRVLRYPFSADIDNWDEEPNVDPRFYCLIKSSNNEVYAISIYDDYMPEYIRKYEQIDNDKAIPTIIKTVTDMNYYELAFSGIDGMPWFYTRDRKKLKEKLNKILKEEKNIKKLLKP